MKLPKDEIERLVSASQSGESDAFGKLYDSFVDPIYRYMYYRVRSDEAEDLTELVFLKTWENIQQYKKGKSSFSSWIFRIAHNIVVDHYRAHRPINELSPEHMDQRLEAVTPTRAHQRFDKELLEVAMKELRDDYRQVLILKFMNDLSNEEIGVIMERSQAALRILQFRALRSLKRVLEKMGVHDF